MNSYVVVESEWWIVGMDGISVHAGLGWFIVVLGAAHAVIVFKELQTY